MIDLHHNAEAGVVELVLNNPKALNSLAEDDLAELSRTLEGTGPRRLDARRPFGSDASQ